jgi:hypothetical protein
MAGRLTSFMVHPDRTHGDKLRAAGLRAVEIWVPDTQRPGFADECRRQSRCLLDDPTEAETLEWLDEAADRDGWT